MITIKQKHKTNYIFGVAVILLVIAFFGNLFIEGWNWSFFDFLLAAILLFGVAFIINLVVKSKKSFMAKLITCTTILLIFLLIWIELAVGLFGSPFAGS
ncbi:hypothetical protein [Chryseobacterium potabilaquae]|uniref:Branched-chain amino acid:cation transporter, LIVCS family n=1 Tax=Chryseobacterium potabilaquae TaxID=2675057 RepID=A0A6N4X9J5_9FLAO|nr:hypothetical protein [Chryseobacterium potabilaquae]CAA7195673.1 hypothetical protein CHRY9293_01845 [Chryseobacterium potabilaquae]